MADIVDSFAFISLKFRELNFKPPVAILLADPEEGMKLLCNLHQKNLVVPLNGDRGSVPVEAPDGSVWMEVDVYGMKVRWPARILAQSGESRWI